MPRLRPCDVKRTTNKPFISIVTMKTEDRLHIELNKYALQILDKYKNIFITFVSLEKQYSNGFFYSGYFGSFFVVRT